MNKLLLSTALVAGLIGGASANKEAVQSVFGSATQFVISDSHAQNANGFARAGSCTYHARSGFRGRSVTLSYDGSNARNTSNDFFDRANIRRNVSSISLTGGARTVLFERRGQRRRITGAISFGMAQLEEGVDNNARSVICGTEQALREVVEFNPLRS